MYYIADGSPAASRIGAADLTAPAAAPGVLWLVSYRLGADMSTAAGTAQEVSVTGAAIGPRLRLPTGYVIERGTRAGLLLVQEQASSGTFRYELWDPGTQRVTRSFVDVIAASPTQIAWMPACAGGCLVHVLDLPGGRTGEIPLPRQSTAGQGAFSPDGQLPGCASSAATPSGSAFSTPVPVIPGCRRCLAPSRRARPTGARRGRRPGWRVSCLPSLHGRDG